ncbi:MAG: helix-turn-helix transcriptional regulator [Bacteroidota bacterium]
MIYREISPPTHLRNFVESIWFYKGEGSLSPYRILPDACVDLIFPLQNSEPEHILFCGLMTRFQERLLPKATKLIGYRFSPIGFMQIFDVPLYETLDQRIEGQALVAGLPTHFLHEIQSLPNLAHQILHINHWLIECIRRSTASRSWLLNFIGKLGQPSEKISQLVNEQNLSLRQLQRRFKAEMGISMKTYQRLLRFRRSLTQLQQSNKRSILDIAFAEGYADHAHMSREFIQLSGLPPSTFR